MFIEFLFLHITSIKLSKCESVCVVLLLYFRGRCFAKLLIPMMNWCAVPTCTFPRVSAVFILVELFEENSNLKYMRRLFWVGIFLKPMQLIWKCMLPLFFTFLLNTSKLLHLLGCVERWVLWLVYTYICIFSISSFKGWGVLYYGALIFFVFKL